MTSKLSFIKTKEKWIDNLIASTDKIEVEEHNKGDVEAYYIHDGYDTYAALGRISSHVDDCFPEWSYILILRTENEPVLYSKGHDKLILKAGMLVELNIHKAHRLGQKPKSTMIWTAVDSHERIPLDRALNRHLNLWHQSQRKNKRNTRIAA